MTIFTYAFLFFICTYISSIISYYLYLKISRSKNGIFENVPITKTDYVMTFYPIINTLLSFIGWIMYYPKQPTTNNQQPTTNN